MDRLDIVIFGASGFTGKYTVENLVRMLPEYPNLTWGIAGRSQEKLSSIMSEVESKTGADLSKIPIIIADIKDIDSLVDMAKKAKVIVNCCGPYRFYGEPVVKACIAGKAHQVDVTGEPQYMETMQLKYDEAAKEAEVYIISACGFDSIPNDMGVVFLEKNFKGTVNSIESYIKFIAPKPKSGESSIHYGTLESAVHGAANANELKPLRRKLYPEKLPTQLPKLKSRFLIHKNVDDGWWYMPFPGSDASIVYRTQRYFLNAKNKRPIQMRPYVGFPSLIMAISILIYFIFFAIACQFKITRKLLLKYPKLATFGTISHEGPTEEAMNKSRFSVVLNGTGWDESVTDFNNVSPNKKLSVEVSGINPGYGSTCVALLISAITIVREQNKIPGRGGVLTTGAAFSETSLIENLHKHNVTFEVLSSDKNQ